MTLGREPTLIIQTIVGVLNVLQIAATDWSSTAKTIIAAVIIALGALLNRQLVTPARAAGK